ncbi:MAG TPA: glutamine synthetase beta-grasp domain-containing protein, partial [Bacillota bacterium]|nr:glutamine synthetase beta-grasp domain-containing protein [Bacillota bacterium]
MNYSKKEVAQYISEEDVKFIRLAFCDVFGRQKNISIMQNELERAFEVGIALDASAVRGFGGDVHSDLFLHPDPATISVLPWRPEHGKVVRMFCSVSYPDGKPFEADARTLLKNAISDAKAAGVTFHFGSETEFYLFKRD